VHALIRKHAIDTVVVRYAYAAHRTLLTTMQATPDFVLVDVEDRYATFVEHAPASAALGLHPSYDPDWLLAATPTQAAATLRDLARLPNDDAHAGYRAYVHAMLALQPMLRGAPRDGLRRASNPFEQALLRQAAVDLARASRGAEVPLLDAYRALALIASCQLDAAAEALTAAEREGGSREASMGRMEWHLARGEVETVRAMLRGVEGDLRAAGDVWIDALRTGVSRPVRCGL
jgi:hypothetical protein